MFIRFPAVLLSLIGILIALLTSSLLALVGFELALLALCIVDAAMAPRTSTITVTRSGAVSTRAHEAITHTLTLSTSGKRTIHGQIRDAWPGSAGVKPSRSHFTLLGARKQAQNNASARATSTIQGAINIQGNPTQSIEIPETLTPTRRGTRKSEHITFRINGPLGLAGRQASRPTEWDVRVLPEFSSRKHLPSRVARLRELEGRALLLVRGQGTEFDSLREYVAGDDVRAIDWRSSARLGTTVVRTWRPERDRKVIILVDCGRGGALRIDDAPAFDAYIESSLLLSALAARAGDRTYVLALDSSVQAHVADGKGAPIINRLGEAFADIEPTLAATDWNLASTQIDMISHQPALVVALTTLGLSTVTDGLIDVATQLARRHTVVVGSVRDTAHKFSLSPNVEEAYEEAAQAKADVEKNSVASALKRAGCVVVHADAPALPPLIADTYIELKAQGKL